MALTSQERKELGKLYVKCMDKDGETVRPDADKKDLVRLQALLTKTEPEAQNETGEPRPEKIKNYVHSEHCKSLIAEGAEFQGVEIRNHGSQEKPRMVLREWLYTGVRGKDRKAVFVQEGKVIEAGRTIAEAAYRRLSK